MYCFRQWWRKYSAPTINVYVLNNVHSLFTEKLGVGGVLSHLFPPSPPSPFCFLMLDICTPDFCDPLYSRI